MSEVEWTSFEVIEKEVFKDYGYKFICIKPDDKEEFGLDTEFDVFCIICEKYHNTNIQHLLIDAIDPHPKCKRVRRWDFDKFVRISLMIFKGKYTYKKPTKEFDSHAPIKTHCTECHKKWETNVGAHINCRKGCLRCAGLEPWTWEEFLEAAVKIHGDKYQYIKPEGNINNRIPIKTKCNCTKEWETSIGSHISGEHGCSRCAGNEPWTWEEFLEAATLKHKDRYTYIKPEGNINSSIMFKIKCSCTKEWETSISSHVVGEHGCARCYGNEKRSWEDFVKLANERHNDTYEYIGPLKPEEEFNNNSYVRIVCKVHGEWNPTSRRHINQGCGCPGCKKSQGEVLCETVLIKYGYTYEWQAKIKDGDRKKYDFVFTYNGITYVLEYDGKQHFNRSTRFHASDEDFKKAQSVDAYKTYKALNKGYKVIRIDNTQKNNIEFHIKNALDVVFDKNPDKKIYTSNDIMYEYIFDGLNKIAEEKRIKRENKV